MDSFVQRERFVRLDPADAFLCGYLIHVVGVQFDGWSMIWRVRDATPPPGPVLGERAARLDDDFRERGPGVIADVRRLEALLRKAGLAVPPEPPRRTCGSAIPGGTMSLTTR